MVDITSTFAAIAAKQFAALWQAAAFCVAIDVALAPSDVGAAFWGAIGGLIIWIALKNSLTWWEGLLRVIGGAIVAVSFDGAGISLVQSIYPDGNAFGALRGGRVLVGFGGVALVATVSDFLFSKAGLHK